jgi:hypothetical protein
VNFVAGSSNKLQKLSLEPKKSVESSMRLLTLGPMAQATLILIMFRSNPKIFRVSALYHGYGLRIPPWETSTNVDNMGPQ